MRENQGLTVEPSPEPELVSFPSGDLTLRGLLYRAVDGEPAPVMIWNHGSERDPALESDLAGFYLGRGYAFFAPHRRGHGESPGEYPIAAAHAELTDGTDGGSVSRRRMVERILELHRESLEDTRAVISWLRGQAFVDGGRMVMSGVSHGGVQTILAAEAGGGVRAHVAFAPAAMAWEGNPEIHRRLVEAVRGAREPILVLQAANDYSLGPSRVLGEELARKGGQNRARVYPAYGDSADAGHGAFACRGADVWGDEVMAFLARALATGE